MNEQRLQELRELLPEVDRDLHRAFPFEIEEVRDSGAGEGQYTVVGHAAVFNRWSLDLGGFRERIKKGAFDNALATNPHVVHTWDHDTSKILSSTTNKTLDLSIDPKGLRYWSKVAPTSYAADLRILLDRRDIDQSSFAFTVAKDEWRIKEDDDGREFVERDIVEVDQLFDVTTTAMGAYPTTDAALAVRSLISGRRSGAGLVVAADERSFMRQGDKQEDAPADPVVTPQTSEADVRRELEQLKRHADQTVKRVVERKLKRGKDES